MTPDRVVLIYESPYTEGEYPRLDFICDSLQEDGFSVRIYACGPVTGSSETTVGWQIRHSPILRVVNALAYFLTLRAFAHLGFLLRMWGSLTESRPVVVLFYRHWTGLFLLFWRKLTRSPTLLVWDWYDLDTRMHYFARRMGILGRGMAYAEERLAPRHFDGVIVPTRFAQKLLEVWGMRREKAFVLGEIRGLNPYVNQQVLAERVKSLENGGPIQVAWVGVVRDYQEYGLNKFIQALRNREQSIGRTILNVIGPLDISNSNRVSDTKQVDPELTIVYHGPMTKDAIDRLLARSHLAIHPMPDELFCHFIYSRKMADYLASSLPVGYSDLEGLKEVGRSFGAAFNLDDPGSVCSVFHLLCQPDNYTTFLTQAWKRAREEYSKESLARKGSSLTDFLQSLVCRMNVDTLGRVMMGNRDKPS